MIRVRRSQGRSLILPSVFFFSSHPSMESLCCLKSYSYSRSLIYLFYSHLSRSTGPRCRIFHSYSWMQSKQNSSAFWNGISNFPIEQHCGLERIIGRIIICKRSNWIFLHTNISTQFSIGHIYNCPIWSTQLDFPSIHMDGEMKNWSVTCPRKTISGS